MFLLEGACDSSFAAAQKCYIDSEAEVKGSDCLDKFRAMHQCFQENPLQYNLILKQSKGVPALSISAEEELWHKWNFAK